MFPLLRLGLFVPVLTLSAIATAAGDAELGRQIYLNRCTACHSPDFNGVGPAHRGVFGRPIGKLTGYEYSPALKAASETWTTENLDRWLTDPEKFLPGQRMGIRVEDEVERANVIEYLKTLQKRE